MPERRSTVSTYARKGGYRISGARLLFFFLAINAGAAQGGSARLEQLEQLARGGAPGLAIALLAEHEPDYAREPKRWQEWVKAGVELRHAQNDWEGIVATLADLPESAGAEFLLWAESARAGALLAAGKPTLAREAVSRLLWQSTGSNDQRRAWRELIIESYLAQKRHQDALTAMRRFRHDYGEGGLPDAVMRATILIQSGSPAYAATELAPYAEKPQVQALLLLAQLRAGGEPKPIIERAEQRLKETTDAAERFRLRAVLAEAAARAGDPARQIAVLELQLGGALEMAAPFAMDAEQLWGAYHDYARRVGNQSQLLIGDDRAWFELAEEEVARYPIRSRALLALLALEAIDAEARERAHAQLVERVLALPDGRELLARLYLHSDRFTSGLPQAPRYPLIDRALANGNLEEAALLLKGLEEPPAGVERAMWQLRRAKVLILAGDYVHGVEVLQALAGDVADFSPAMRDRLVQVVFDLQAVHQHEPAYRLFEQIYAEVADLAVKRELLFWMADSLRALEQPREAAYLYMQSAMMAGTEALDPWAQTARYEAAKSLADAGMFADARNLYRQLLTATDNPSRRAVLRQEMERLVLLEGQRR